MKFLKKLLSGVIIALGFGAVFATTYVSIKYIYGTNPVAMPKTAFFSGGYISGNVQVGGTMLMDIGSGNQITTYIPLVDGSGNAYTTGSGLLTGGALSGYILWTSVDTGFNNTGSDSIIPSEKAVYDYVSGFQFTITGATGPTGAMGATGADGLSITGATGATGATGTNGIGTATETSQMILVDNVLRRNSYINKLLNSTGNSIVNNCVFSYNGQFSVCNDSTNTGHFSSDFLSTFVTGTQRITFLSMSLDGKYLFYYNWAAGEYQIGTPNYTNGSITSLRGIAYTGYTIGDAILSSDGKNILLYLYTGATDSRLALSKDYGATFASIAATSSPASVGNGFDMSYNGAHILMYSGGLWKSDDYGNSFRQLTLPSNAVGDMHISEDGKNIVICKQLPGYTGYYSTDFGSSFSIITGALGGDLTDQYFFSPDSKIIVYSNDTPTVYISQDYGATATAITNMGATSSFFISPDLSIGIATDFSATNWRFLSDVSYIQQISIQLQNILTCNSTEAGVMKFSGTNFYGCDGTTWDQLN